MNKNLDKQLAQVFENNYPGYECFVEKVINVIFTGDDTYEAFQSAEDLTTDEKRRRKANESGILKILKVGEIDAPVPIEVFDITLSDDKDLQYNRVGIQSFIRSDLFMFTNAFMLFHNENPEGKDWRFSFAYKDTTIKGMTPAKRYTYLFGKNHRARTASERFAKLADAEKDTQNLLNAFSVEALSKDFFNGYKEQYKAFCDFLFAHKDDREYFGPKFSQWEDKYLRDYVKKMMGRITFIYFLQRKGWMNGDLDYMQKAFENSTCKDDYLDSFLEPLFCGVLNTKPEERAELFKSLGWNLSLLDGWNDIPYLNGGLFERDEQDKPKSKFPAQMFKNLFDFYSRYNFTIYENDPDDAEVGIDPEMLGHIFENLLEDNKDKGAFYTPKEIVQYMSRESIAQYLKTHADEALHTAIDELIKDGKVGEALQDKANATAIYRLLCDVKVCDPAIGSGAFPMGVLNVLYHARMLLYAFTRPTQGFSPAMVKREIIQNNIYGVDIEKGAVDIARLRFWLALVVDEEEPQPLPNLDYKIMCGNSLIHRFALDAPFQNVLKHYNKENKTNITLDDYRQWVYDYTNISDHTQKDNFRQKIEDIKHAFKTELSMKEIDKISKVRGKIEDLQSKDIFGNQKGSATEIKKLQGRLKVLEAQRDDIEANKLYDNAFEWRFEFPALLDEKGNFTGFDVVIGNPPYVNINTMPQFHSIFKETYPEIHTGYNDLMYYFICQGTRLLSFDGVLSYITSNYYLGNDYAKKLRLYLNDKLETVINFHNAAIFDSASVHTAISFVRKKSEKRNIQFYTLKNDICSSLKLDIDYEYCELKRENLNDSWIVANSSSDMIIEKIKKISVPMGTITEIAKGPETGKNGIFSVAKSCLDENRIEKEIIRHCIKNSHIKKYVISPIDLYLIYADNDFSETKYPNAYKYLCQHKKDLLDRRGPKNDEYEWWRLHRPSIKYIFDSQEKIVVPYRAEHNRFAYDDKQFFNDGGDIRAIIVKENSKYSIKFLLGLLNSNMLDWYYGFIGKQKGCAREYFNKPLSEIPIFKATQKQQQPIIDLVDKILAAKKENPQADTSEWEKEIDRLVYELYGLTEKEVKVVENSNK